MQDIEFNDEFEEETDICSICGAETVLTGWNEVKDLSRFECSDCGAIFAFDGEGNESIIKGKKRNWVKFLSENLTFPFEAWIDEDDLFEEAGPLQYGDKVVVQNISGYVDLYGVIVEIKKGRKTYKTPLSDLAVDDKKSLTFKIVDNYRTWVANCQ